MKDVFDYLEEEDLLRNLPEALPQMEDEIAAKRIENLVSDAGGSEAAEKMAEKAYFDCGGLLPGCGRGICTQADCSIFPAYPALSARCWGLYQRYRRGNL